MGIASVSAAFLFVVKYYLVRQTTLAVVRLRPCGRRVRVFGRIHAAALFCFQFVSNTRIVVVN